MPYQVTVIKFFKGCPQIITRNSSVKGIKAFIESMKIDTRAKEGAAHLVASSNKIYDRGFAKHRSKTKRCRR